MHQTAIHANINLLIHASFKNFYADLKQTKDLGRRKGLVEVIFRTFPVYNKLNFNQTKETSLLKRNLLKVKSDSAELFTGHTFKYSFNLTILITELNK